jgi:c-di-AMP phosphodiesterase-like protein
MGAPLFNVDDTSEKQVSHWYEKLFIIAGLLSVVFLILTIVGAIQNWSNWWIFIIVFVFLMIVTWVLYRSKSKSTKCDQLRNIDRNLTKKEEEQLDKCYT